MSDDAILENQFVQRGGLRTNGENTETAARLLEGEQERTSKQRKGPVGPSDEFIVGGKTISLAKVARRAGAARGAFLWFSIVNSFGLVAAIACSALLLAIAVGAVGMPNESAAVTDRIDILNWLGRVLLVGTVVAWSRYVFWDGWLFYPPSNPVAGRRGSTRAWYNSVTFVATEEPAEVADGLTHALNLTLRSKLRASLIMVWGIAVSVTSIAVVTVTTVNYWFVHEFSAALAALVSENWEYVQYGVIYAVRFGETRGAEELAFSGVPEPLAFGLFLVAPSIALLFAQQLIVNAIDMRWSLLSTPDVLYKMLKYVLLVRNTTKDYTFEHAVRDARELVLLYGVNEIPEDFVDTEGRLFFYSENMRQEFLRGSAVAATN